eukprot:2068050-Amphidinium_carterae.4
MFCSPYGWGTPWQVGNYLELCKDANGNRQGLQSCGQVQACHLVNAGMPHANKFQRKSKQCKHSSKGGKCCQNQHCSTLAMEYNRSNWPVVQTLT